MRRWLTAAVVLGGVGAVTALGATLVPGVAGAQEGEATIEVEQAHPLATGVHYFVRLTAADGEPVNGATVTATPTSPDGTPGTEATLTPFDDDGRYEGPVELPEDGAWTVTFASSEPGASIEYTQQMPLEGGPEASSSSAAAGGDDDEGTPVVPLVLAGVFVALLAALGIWTLVERRRPAAATATTAATGPATTATPADPAGPGPAGHPSEPIASDQQPRP